MAALLASCQKKYERPDIVLGGSSGTTSTVLTKSTSKTQGSTEAVNSFFEYDGSNRLVKITSVNIDSNNASTTIMYRYIRDASGKIINIITNELAADYPGLGYPDSLTINLHYPDNSANFDYAAYHFTISGTVFSDSVSYGYTSGQVTNVAEYRSVTTTYSLVGVTQYSYANANVVTQRLYDVNSSTTTPAVTYNYEYDAKTTPLYTGNEGVLIGQSLSNTSKNNPLKITVIDNTSNSVAGTASYTYQYNTAGLPATGTIVYAPDNKNVDLTFTYK